MLVELYEDAEGQLHLVWETWPVDPETGESHAVTVTTTTSPWEGGLAGDAVAIDLRHPMDEQQLAEIPKTWRRAAVAETGSLATVEIKAEQNISPTARSYIEAGEQG